MLERKQGIYKGHLPLVRRSKERLYLKAKGNFMVAMVCRWSCARRKYFHENETNY